MPDSDVGTSLYLSIGKAGQTRHVFQGEASGLESAELVGRRPPIRTAGGGDSERRQKGAKRDTVLSIRCDRNSISADFFYDEAGEEVEFDLGPDGNATGDTRYSGTCLLENVRWTMPTNNKYTLQVQAPCDGTPVKGAFA